MLYQGIRLAGPGCFYRGRLRGDFYLRRAGRHTKVKIQDQRLPDGDHYVSMRFRLKAGDLNGDAVGCRRKARDLIVSVTPRYRSAPYTFLWIFHLHGGLWNQASCGVGDRAPDLARCAGALRMNRRIHREQPRR